jgi:hypothetical protein
MLLFIYSLLKSITNKILTIPGLGGEGDKGG